MGSPRRWRQASSLWALLAVLEGARGEADDLDLHIPTGCFQYGYKFHPAMQNISGMPYHMDSVLECQMKCRMVDGCYHFAYWQKTRECWLADITAKIYRAPVEGSVTGAGTCPEDTAACTAIPGPTFPANTDTDTRLAWPGGQQPTNLQCWPRLRNGFPNKCKSRMATVLEDTAAGWPGKCANLVKVTDLQQGETCQMRCFNSALCGVWAVENLTQLGVVSCWQAMNGVNCTSGSPIKPIRAQRVMHGSFRVLMNTMGMQIMNLTKAFDVKDVGSAREGVKRCRKTCLSYLFCQFWQYSNVYGCWLEDPSVRKVAYPLVNNGVDMRTEVETSNTVKAGEYIQHFCADEAVVPLPTDPPGSVAAVQSGRVAMSKENNHEHAQLNDKMVPGVSYPTAAPVAPGPAGAAAVMTPPTSPPSDPDLEGQGRGGGGGGVPNWASFLIGFAIALTLVAVGLGVWMTVIDGDKQGTRGNKYGRPNSSRNMSSYASSYASDSRAQSFASESQPMMHAYQGPPNGHHGFGDWVHAMTQQNMGGMPTAQHMGNMPTQHMGGYGYGQNGYGHGYGRH